VPFITSAILVIGTIFLNLGIDDGRKVKRADSVEAAAEATG
jgi:hypothetical protein